MKVNKPFLIISLAILGMLLATLYKRYILFSNYKNPPDVLSFTLIFEYIAFGAIAFLFPWSYHKYNGLRRAYLVTFIAIVFGLIYLFLLSIFDWLEGGQSYAWINGFRFSLLHSSPYVLGIYGIISIFLVLAQDRFLKPPDQYLEKLETRIKNQVQFIPLDQVKLISADGNYLSVIDEKQQKYLVRETMKKIEKRLDPEKFLRVHRKYIVNKDSVRSYYSSPGGGYVLTLDDDREVKVSKNYVYQIKNLKEKIGKN